jgi:hypothetical protein
VSESIPERLSELERQLGNVREISARIEGHVFQKPESRFSRLQGFVKDLLLPTALAILAVAQYKSADNLGTKQLDSTSKISNAQLEATKADSLKNAELKCLELFWEDITSGDESKQRLALGLVKLVNDALAVRILSMIAQDPQYSPAIQRLALAAGKPVVDQLLLRDPPKTPKDINPKDLIAVMRQMEALVSKGSYEEALGYAPLLKQANTSGVGFSVYPELALALSESGKPSESEQVLKDLVQRIERDVVGRSGYLSSADTLEMVIEKLSRLGQAAKQSETKKQFAAVMEDLTKTTNWLKDPTRNPKPPFVEKVSAQTQAEIVKRAKVRRLMDENKPEEALAIDPNNLFVVTETIRSRVRKGQYVEALALRDPLERLNSSGAGDEAYIYLFLAHAQLGNQKEAKEILEIIRASCAEELARSRLTDLLRYRRQRLKEAEELLQSGENKLELQKLIQWLDQRLETQK